jgi:hypothetical protein
MQTSLIDLYKDPALIPPAPISEFNATVSNPLSPTIADQDGNLTEEE